LLERFKENLKTNDYRKFTFRLSPI